MLRAVSVAALTSLLAAGLAAAAGAPAGASTRSAPQTRHHQVHRAWPANAPRANKAAVAALRARHPRALSAQGKLSPKLVAADGAGGPTVDVIASGTDAAALGAAVRAAHGKVLAAVPGKVTAAVPVARLAGLAASRSVTSIDRAVHAYAQSGPVSEGVAATNAGPANTTGTWQHAGIDGTGVDIGIVDGGFEGLSSAVASGDLPAGQVVADNRCANVDGTPHGTAVAEIVHQMAPGAILHLYCIDDTLGLHDVEPELVSAHVSVVNCSLAFPGDSRGDGTGASTSATASVAAARKAGILWVESAGNSATDHWHGTLTDADADSFVDIDGVGDGTDDYNESDSVVVLGTDDAGSSGGNADLHLQWDQWPTSSAVVELAAFGSQCNDEACSTTTVIDGGQPMIVGQSAGTAPVLDIPVADTNAYPQIWQVFILIATGVPPVRYDLTYEGDVADSYLSGVDSARAASGSIETPANSPYALAVGAADVGADGTTAGTFEPFSSQGPTIDGRTKPNITGWDGVSSPVYGVPSSGGTGGFYGTSAATPHVVGAAALVKDANPSLDAAQIQNLLEQRASSGRPLNPPTQSEGYGLLTLGAPTGVTAPTGSRYVPLAPTRILDTRTSGDGRVGSRGQVTFAVSSGVPTSATAVAVNLTAVNASASTYLSIFPDTSAGSTTSNLNVSPTDPTAAVFAIVGLGGGRHLTVRNALGTTDVVVDQLGYFTTGSHGGAYTALSAPKRVLDTRTTTGGHHAKLTNHGIVLVHPGVPSTATAAIVNVTAVGATSGGYLSTAPSCSRSTSTLNYAKFPRANLALVSLTGSTPGFCVENGGPAVDAIVDVVGYMGPGGAQYYPLPTAQRIVDTRTGNGGSADQAASRPFGAAATTAFYGSNVGDVPANASALFTGVVEATNTAGGYLGLFPGATKPAGAASALNFTPGRVVANADVVGLSGHQFGVYNGAGSTNAAIDVFGYFGP